MVVYTFSPRTQEAEAGLVYKVNSRTTWVMKKDLAWGAGRRIKIKIMD